MTILDSIDYIFDQQSDPIHLIWTKSGMDTLLIVISLWKCFSSYWRALWSALSQEKEKENENEHKWSVFDITLNAPFQFEQKLAWTSSLTLKQAYGRIYLFSQDSRWEYLVKGQKQPNLIPQIIFRLRIGIPSIWFGQNLAWTYIPVGPTNKPA